MTNHKYKDKYDPSQNTVCPAYFPSRFITDAITPGGKSQGQKSGIGKDITDPSRDIIKIVGSKRQPQEWILLISS